MRSKGFLIGGIGTLMVTSFLGLPPGRLIITSSIVAGTSCEPEIHNKSYILFSSIPIFLGNFDRGDYVVLKRGFERYVKKLEGISGDHIRNDASGFYVNGFLRYSYDPKDELYNIWLLESQKYAKEFPLDTFLKEDEYFVVGPNVYESLDSRLFGPVKGKDLVAKVIGK